MPTNTVARRSHARNEAAHAFKCLLAAWTEAVEHPSDHADRTVETAAKRFTLALQSGGITLRTGAPAALVAAMSPDRMRGNSGWALRTLRAYLLTQYGVDLAMGYAGTGPDGESWGQATIAAAYLVGHHSPYGELEALEHAKSIGPEHGWIANSQWSGADWPEVAA